MKLISSSPRLAEQVHEALVSEIAQGKLKPGERVIQEQVAQQLGVSRQPVQQALLLLRNQGVLDDAPGRGLIVAPMDPQQVRHMYDVRAVMEGLAFRRAAEHGAGPARRLGPSLVAKGRRALAGNSLPDLITADLAFHSLVHGLSGNPLIAPTMEAQWIYTQRVMGEVLLGEDTPQTIWAQHEAMLEAVMAGDGDRAERLAREHIDRAAEIVVGRLRADAAHSPSAVERPAWPLAGFAAAASPQRGSRATPGLSLPPLSAARAEALRGAEGRPGRRPAQNDRRRPQ